MFGSTDSCMKFFDTLVKMGEGDVDFNVSLTKKDGSDVKLHSDNMEEIFETFLEEGLSGLKCDISITKDEDDEEAAAEEKITFSSADLQNVFASMFSFLDDDFFDDDDDDDDKDEDSGCDDDDSNECAQDKTSAEADENEAESDSSDENSTEGDASEIEKTAAAAAETAVTEEAAADEQKAEPARTETGGSDVISLIKSLAELKDSGILTEAEFAAKKAELLARL